MTPSLLASDRGLETRNRRVLRVLLAIVGALLGAAFLIGIRW